MLKRFWSSPGSDYARLRGRLAIFMFHAVVRDELTVPDWCFTSEREFEQQLDFIQKHFEIIPLERALEGESLSTSTRPVACLTFDDGYRNTYETAFPILRARGLPATTFLTTELIDSDRTLWFCLLNRAMARTDRRSIRWHGQSHALVGTKARAKASALLQAALKELAPAQMLEELSALVVELGDDPDAPVAAEAPYRMLDRALIQEMIASGLMDFEPHGHSHRILGRLSRQQQRSEIEDSVCAIEKITGKKARFFAYPNGRSQDYDEDTQSILREQGIEAALTAEPGINDTRTPRFAMRRVPMGADTRLGSATQALFSDPAR